MFHLAFNISEGNQAPKTHYLSLFLSYKFRLFLVVNICMFFFSSIFFNISLLFIWSLYIIPSNFWCNRNDFPIVICHLGGASEFRQVALVTVFPFQYQTPSATSTAWTGAHRTFTEETFLNR